MNEKELYAAAAKLTSKYSGAVRKHLLLMIGCMLYIAFAVMATMIYGPSYFACIKIGGTVWGLLNSVVNAVFITLFIFFMIQGFFEDAFLKDFREGLPNLLFVCVLYLVVSYGLLIFRCRNPHTCFNKEEGGDTCTVQQLTTFNKLVTNEVNRTKAVRQLFEYYKKQMGTDRVSISSCSNYYDASYTDMEASKKTCSPQTANTVCNISEDPAVGAPILSEFFVMTSGRTCVVGPQYDGYMSAHMIAIALTGGARCLDFDISALDFSKDATPIVTVSRDRDNRNLQRNFVLFEDCLHTIMRYWFGADSVVGNVAKREPLFIHLNLRRGLTTKCMDNVAKQLFYYFNEYGGEHLLPADFHYSAVNLGSVPVCMLFNRVVIMVNAPYRAPSVVLDPLINLYSGVDAPTEYFQETDWSDVKNATNPRDTFVTFNRTNITYVETSFHPYRPISNILKPGEGGLASDLNAKYTTRDSMTDLILNKQTINNGPVVPFQYGCQFVAMNFQNLDSDMELYLGFFRYSSFLLKPQALRREKLPVTAPVAKFGKCAATATTLSRLSKGADTSLDKCQQVCLTEDRAKIFLSNSENSDWSRGDCDTSDFPQPGPPTGINFGGISVTASSFLKS
jgi:hypothetical protein